MPIKNKSKDMIQTILVIAGSDPCGGAGIQADLKTITTIGGYCAAVITCITVQNSYGVTNINALSPELIKKQIFAVFQDHNVTHVKIGMVGDITNSEAIAQSLDTFEGTIVYDPVMNATTGQQLFRQEQETHRPDKLINRVSVLTPNIPELETLTNKKVTSKTEALSASRLLLSEFANLQSILLKGGHADDMKDITDYFVFKYKGKIEIESATHPRILSKNSHGTGCTLASAFSTYHTIYNDNLLAFHHSIKYMSSLIKLGSEQLIVRNPSGCGPLLHYKWKEI